MARPAIQDQFTHLEISRQRKFQLRQKLKGCCTICGEPSPGASRCLKHLVMSRERQRKKRGLRGRYNSLSYRLESALRGKKRQTSTAA